MKSKAKRGPLTKNVVPATPTQRALRVFLCHSSNDKPAVRKLYNRLKADNIELWLDERKLLAGQDWNLEITKAVRSANVVIVCLSRSSVNKAGYIQKEIKDALDVADEQPEGTIFLIPLKLEECDVPERLRRWHWVNFFEDDGYTRLMSALSYRATTLGIPESLISIADKKILEHPPQGKIKFPNDGDVVSRLFRANGSIDKLPTDYHRYLAVEIRRLMWPKEPEIAVNGTSWSGEVYEGENPPDGRFNLSSNMVDGEGHRKIMTWLENGIRTGNYPGLLELTGGQRLHSIKLQLEGS